MANLSRFSISIEASLLERLEQLVTKRRYANRSEFVRDLLRERLVEDEWKADEEVVGTITLVYDHHRPHVLEAVTGLQHDCGAAIISTLHVHLDHDNCLEVLVVRGPASRIKEMADQLIAIKGVKHGKLTVTTTGKHLPS